MYKKNTQALTLMELLIVMTIIFVLAGLIVGTSGPASQSAKKRKAEVMISALETAATMYHADTGLYPPDAETGFPNSSAVLYDYLTNTTTHEAGGSSAVAGWSGPYMEFKRSEDLSTTTPYQILDPWKNAYHYDSTSPTNNTHSFDLWSNGPDKTDDSGGDDDINNW
ncbi:MAG: type II secretion system protein GspG [Candidatus Omnitrophica bacterium]|nr:type II secretion system protein GspG [Candidatus Omnitrophota bacterium]